MKYAYCFAYEPVKPSIAMKYLLSLVFVFCSLAIFAQCPGTISFSNQADVDAFPTNYPGCTTINGDLRIYNGPTNLNGLSSIVTVTGNLLISSNTTLPNLNGLSSLTTIGGRLSITSTSLPNFSGLNNLNAIGDRLYVWNNSSLNDISALSNLTTVGTDVNFENCNILTNFSGLEGLTTINGDLYIRGNALVNSVAAFLNVAGVGEDIVLESLPMLGNLSGLNNVTSVTNRLYIRNNNSLSDISALSNVATVGGNVTLEGLPMLEDLDGLNSLISVGTTLLVRNTGLLTDISALSNLTTIGDQLFIEGTALSTLNGLQNVTSIGSLLYLRGNNELTDIKALGNIAANTISDLRILQNSSLCFCSIQNICDYLAIPLNSASVSSNQAGGGCVDRAAIEAACGIVDIQPEGPCGVSVALEVLLEGPYQPASGLMTDNLRASALIPTLEPYTAIGYTHFGGAGGETVNPMVFDVIGPNAIVDWILIELREATDNTTSIASRTALLQADGDIVDLDGVSPVFFRGVGAGAYFVVVRHRNHLDVMTSTALPLTGNAYAHDFTGGDAYGYPAYPETQIEVTTGVFCMNEADFEQDGAINAADRSIAWNFRNQTGYISNDSNFDGYCNAAERSVAWNNRNKQSQVP